MSFPRYERYKDSGVEWLGEVPEHWEICSLRHCLEDVFNGLTCDQIDPTESSVPVTRIETISTGLINRDKVGFIRSEEARENRKLLAGDILFSNINSLPMVGNCALFEGGEELYAGMNLLVLRSSHKINSKWLYWLIRSDLFRSEVEANAKPAINQASISQASLKNISIPRSTDSEQVAIATFLNKETAKIDALLEEQKRLIEVLKEKRQALISHSITKGFNPRVSYKVSGADWLGDVPSHWSVERAGHLFIERDERSESGDEEMLTVSHLTGVTPRSEKTVNMFEAETTEGYKKVYPGDLVINTLWAWMGAMGVSSHTGIVSPAYHVYRLGLAMKPDYVNALVRMSAFAKEASRWSKGVWSSRLRLYPQEMFQISFPVPPLKEQEQISERIRVQDEDMTNLIRESELGIALLQERRNAVISAAVSGKIDVRDFTPKEAA